MSPIKKLLFLALLIAYTTATGSEFANDKALADIFSPIRPISDTSDEMKTRRELGQQLFLDPRISANGSISCSSCHQAHYYGADSQSKSFTISKKQTSHNTQSVFNLNHQFVFHWYGDRESLEDQAIQSFTSEEGLGHKDKESATKALKKWGYDQKLKKIFPKEDPILEKAAKVLADFQRHLLTRSPFDRYLEGDISALSAIQKKGLKTFMNLGCVSCHNGAAIGGKSIQRFGITRDYWEVTGSTEKDPGRYTITKLDSDRNVFKIPSLRNVAMTAPYFHDGSAPDLPTAVRWMGELQLDRKLNDKEVESIVAFLKSLTGEPPSPF